MDVLTLFAAISYIDDADILRAGEVMSAAGPAQGAVRYRRLRLLLIAAAIAALVLTACTAAVVLFGLDKRLTPAEDPLPTGLLSGTPAPSGGYLSPYGPADSPEAQASLEWALYERSHEEERTGEAWYSDDKTENTIQKIYGAFDREALDKLYEVRDTYGLTLHSAWTQPLNNEDLYLISGTGRFFLAENEMGTHGLYEDGSFTAEGLLPLSDDILCSFRIDRSKAGVLVPPATLYVRSPESYEQWQYTTSRGDTVAVAYDGAEGGPNNPFADGAFLFFEKGSWSATIHLNFYSPGGKASVEAAAEYFDFSALCSGGEDVLRFINAGPTESSTGQALSTADFMASPEYLAAAEFDVQYAAYLTERYEGDSRFGIFNLNIYPCAWPSDDEALDELAREIYEKYSLIPASDAIYFIGGKRYEPEAIIPGGHGIWSEYRDSAREISDEDLYALLGCEPFREKAPFFGYIYDNGSFSADCGNGTLHYIKKGSFYTALALYPMQPPGPDMPAWVYDTAWGGSVTIALDTHKGYCDHMGEAYILYETDKAYIVLTFSSHEPRILEGTIDGIDLSRLG